MIDHLKIEGYKSFKKLEIELQPLNILIGSNGSGKSNFLSYFRLVNAIFNRQLQRFVLEEKTDNILRHGRKHTKQMEGKIVLKKEEGFTNSYSFELVQNNEGGLFIGVENSGYSEPFKMVTKGTLSSTYAFRSGVEESSCAVSSDVSDRRLRQYIRTIKAFHFHDTSSTSALRRECDIEDNAVLHSDGGNLPAFLYLLQQKHPKIFSRIEKVIQTVAPYIDRLILEPRQLSEGGNEIALRWADKGNPESSFSAYQLSDGTLRFIVLATLLMQPSPPAVIIIDEPELGLHPFAIGKLASMMQAASADTQIIAATQSPGLISHFNPEDVLVLDRTSSESETLMQRLDGEQLKAWLQDYSLGDLWERNILNSAQPFQK